MKNNYIATKSACYYLNILKEVNPDLEDHINPILKVLEAEMIFMDEDCRRHCKFQDFEPEGLTEKELIAKTILKLRWLEISPSKLSTDLKIVIEELRKGKRIMRREQIRGGR